ncbi:MAG: hypothetical protein L6R42_001580, partial [Xanthoria sp. 1 TBL-2021]
AKDVTLKSLSTTLNSGKDSLEEVQGYDALFPSNDGVRGLCTDGMAFPCGTLSKLNRWVKLETPLGFVSQ